MHTYPESALAHARSFIATPVYSFTALEKELCAPFFTNTDKKVYLMHTLPQSIGTALLSMFSRMKNPRGLRGIFADNFMPEMLASMLKETTEKFGGDGAQFLKHYGIASFDAFVTHSTETKKAWEAFRDAVRVDTKFLEELTHAEKIMRFMKRWLDAYGHNSIARMGAVWICFEQISALAAKSLEWGRPGAGYIELSTRYVDMSKRGYYPIHKELAAYGVDEKRVQDVMDAAFSLYTNLEGEKFTGPFPQFLRKQYGALFAGNEKDLESGVIGETCDVLGNFLPSATQTSVGVNVSGEGLQELIKHLILDNTPENIALVGEILVEAKKTGVDQFIRHTEATPWKEESWKYLSTAPFEGNDVSLVMDSTGGAEETICRAFSRKIGYEHRTTFDEVVGKLLETPRGEYDKLPNEFELASASFAGKITFRGWRDVQRQGFCTHLRTYVTPLLGFYRYDKQAPAALTEAFAKIHAANLALYTEMGKKGVPDELMQYPLSLGNMIGFLLASNMLEIEFCNWQRSKFSVNHEVRQIFLAMEQHMRAAYPWWEKLSRANTTPAYVFARGNTGIPLK